MMSPSTVMITSILAAAPGIAVHGKAAAVTYTHPIVPSVQRDCNPHLWGQASPGPPLVAALIHFQISEVVGERNRDGNGERCAAARVLMAWQAPCAACQWKFPTAADRRRGSPAFPRCSAAQRKPCMFRDSLLETCGHQRTLVLSRHLKTPRYCPKNDIFRGRPACAVLSPAPNGPLPTPQSPQRRGSRPG